MLALLFLSGALVGFVAFGALCIWIDKREHRRLARDVEVIHEDWALRAEQALPYPERLATHMQQATPQRQRWWQVWS